MFIDVNNYIIKIKCESFEEMIHVREQLHDKLVGNSDYIDNNIVLNGSDDRCDGTENEVHIAILGENVSVPELFGLVRSVNLERRGRCL